MTKIKNNTVLSEIYSTNQINYSGDIPDCILSEDCQVDEKNLTYIIYLLLTKYCEDLEIQEIDLSSIDLTCLINSESAISIPTSINIKTLLEFYRDHICSIYSTLSDLKDDIEDLKGLTCLNDIIQLDENENITFDPVFNDTTSNVPGILSLSILTPPINGNAIVNIDNKIVYTPDSDFYGNDLIIYQITKGTYSCTASVSIKVNKVVSEESITEIVLEQITSILQSNEYWDLGFEIGTKLSVTESNLSYFNLIGGSWGKGSGKWAKWALCLGRDTKIALSDGSFKTIKEIVDNKLQVDVISFDENTNKLVTGRVTDWFKTKVVDKNEWVKIYPKNGISNPKVLKVTKNHPIWVVNKGWTEASEIKEDDNIYNAFDTLSEEGKQALMGIFLSDGSITKSRFSLTQTVRQRGYTEYLQEKFKIDKLETYIGNSGYNKNKNYKYDRIRLSLGKLCPEFLNSVDKIEKINNYSLKYLTDLAIAFWYMGDGNLQIDHRTNTERMQLHTEGFLKSNIDILVNYLNSKELYCKSYKVRESNTKGDDRSYIIRFTKEGTNNLAKRISSFVFPSFNYKLPVKFRDVNFEIKEDFRKIILQEYNVEKIEISDNEKTQSYFDYKYDIKVDNFHSFIADDIIVHNCNGNNGTDNYMGLTTRGYNVNDLSYNDASPNNVSGNDNASLVKENIPPHKHTYAYQTMEFENCQIAGVRNASGVDFGLDGQNRNLICSGNQNEGTGNGKDIFQYENNSQDGTNNINNQLELLPTPVPVNIVNKYFTEIMIQKIM